jgi:hypothetical protein
MATTRPAARLMYPAVRIPDIGVHVLPPSRLRSSPVHTPRSCPAQFVDANIPAAPTVME